jgi:hypothetical protein
MPSLLKNNLVFKASDEGIVVEWWPTPRWLLMEVCLSIELTLPRWCVDEDDALIGPILIVVATIWNLLHPYQED